MAESRSNDEGETYTSRRVRDVCLLSADCPNTQRENQEESKSCLFAVEGALQRPRRERYQEECSNDQGESDTRTRVRAVCLLSVARSKGEEEEFFVCCQRPFTSSIKSLLFLLVRFCKIVSQRA